MCYTRSNLRSFSVACIFCRDLARLIGKVGFNCEFAVILILSLQLLNAFFCKAAAALIVKEQFRVVVVFSFAQQLQKDTR